MITYQRNMYFSPAEPCTPQVFRELTESAQTEWLITQHRKAKAEGRKQEAAKLKQRLPVLVYGAKDFDEVPQKKSGKLWKRRCLEGIHVNGLFMFDVDHVTNPREIFQRTQAEGFPWEVLLAHVTPGGEGLRLVCKARMEIGNIADNQIELARTLDVQADASCIDASRISFCPMAKEILLLNDELFTYENQEFYERFNQLYREGRTDPTDARRSFDADAAADASVSADSAGRADKQEDPRDDAADGGTDVKWHGYDIQQIIDARYEGALPCAEQSNRHAESLKLATDLIIMLDGDKEQTQRIVEAQPWVQEIIRERNEDVHQTVGSAADRMAKKEKEAGAWPSKAMQAAVEKVAGKTYREITCPPTQAAQTGDGTEGAKGTGTGASDPLPMTEWGGEIERLYEHFPLLSDVCTGLKPQQRPAAVYVAGGLLMTLMTRCWYRFYHRPQEKRRLNCSLLVIGDPASGKSFATELFRLLTGPIAISDKAGLQAINRYKEEVRAKASNKEKPQKPKALVRIHPSRTSNAQFIQDMVNAVEAVDGEEMQLHMLTFDTELDNSIMHQRGGSWIDKTSMELKAFHNEEDGQAYSNLDSPMQNFYVTWNFIYTGTPIALRKKVTPQNFGSGLATRLTVIPLPPTDFEMMEMESFERTDFERIGRLKEWAFKLDSAKGELTLWPLVENLYEWTARRMADARDDESKADEMLLKRCAYHGLNYSAPFILMRHWKELHQEGRYWCGEIKTDETDWRLTELLTNIHYACQRHFFGAMAEAYFDNMKQENMEHRRHFQKTVEAFNRLPEIFTKEDIAKCFGYKNQKGIYVKINRLMKDHLAEAITEGTHAGCYRKLNHSFL